MAALATRGWKGRGRLSVSEVLASRGAAARTVDQAAARFQAVISWFRPSGATSTSRALLP